MKKLDFWYGLFVKCSDEDNVKKRLDYSFKEDLRVFVPKREIIERKAGKLYRREKVLFPGYVFLNGALEQKHIEIMYNVPNLYELLKEGGRPAVIPSEEIDVFKHLMMDDIIGISDVVVEGDQVIVVNGPLASLEGKILQIDKRRGRAKVAIEFLGQIKRVDLGIRLICKVD
jgi:transcriptional antiterminator NusG